MPIAEDRALPILGPADRLVVALDLPTAEEALSAAEELLGLCRRFKVGLELFAAGGRPVVEALKARGAQVFLDLKMHDIPETVGRAVAVAATMGVELLTVHAGGGREMLRRAAAAAKEAAARRGEGPRVLGVTVLTSLDLSDLGEVGVITNNVASVVQQRALLCQEAGLDGVVASPEEVALLRRACGPDFLLVTPGVRPAGTADGDQKRTGLVAQTIRDGADLIVIGRPLREARDPRAAAAAIIAEIAQSAALERRPAP